MEVKIIIRCWSFLKVHSIVLLPRIWIIFSFHWKVAFLCSWNQGDPARLTCNEFPQKKKLNLVHIPFPFLANFLWWYGQLLFILLARICKLGYQPSVFFIGLVWILINFSRFFVAKQLHQVQPGTPAVFFSVQRQNLVPFSPRSCSFRPATKFSLQLLPFVAN